MLRNTLSKCCASTWHFFFSVNRRGTENEAKDFHLQGILGLSFILGWGLVPAGHYLQHSSWLWKVRLGSVLDLSLRWWPQSPAGNLPCQASVLKAPGILPQEQTCLRCIPLCFWSVARSEGWSSSLLMAFLLKSKRKHFKGSQWGQGKTAATAAARK